MTAPMNGRMLLLVSALASASLVGCDGGGNGGGRNNVDPIPTAKSVTDLVSDEIAQNTADSAVPIEINDLPVDEDETNDTSSPDSVN